jgi:hypothetical protein
MILTGSFLAMVSGRIRVAKPLALGIASMIGFPVWAAVDLARNGGHNLLPFEVAIYGAYFVLGTFVAAIGYHWK